MAATLTTANVVARAKINLALHVVGRRDDGYHLLDSIVVFAHLHGASADGGTGDDCGDKLSIAFDEGHTAEPELTVSGPFAEEVPHGRGNSALEAALAVGSIASIHLEKHLPVAVGVGGGSADAAAVLRAAASQGGHHPSRYGEVALRLGADVPVCLDETPARMGGIGETLSSIHCPSLAAVLVNPGVAVATPPVFANLESRENPPLPPWPNPVDAQSVARWLDSTRNDLEPPAIAFAPPIASALGALRSFNGCLLARMSGSGATVFGLFCDLQASREAASVIAREQPGWWVRPASLAPQS
ncbi:MAG: 4-(cytidine 5'-diphospho)-2-C-methyl-D-erythritol kinase [Pseudomonadota bacterium]